MAHSVANPEILVHLEANGRALPLRDACHLLLDTPSTKDCVVDALHHLKSVLGVRHEYLYLDITIRGAVRRTVVVDRTVNKSDKISLSSSKEGAHDKFDIYDRTPYPDECLVETLKFQSLPLANLLRLFRHITEIAPAYDILDHQCIWFAGSLMEASRAIWLHTHLIGPLASEKGHTSFYVKIKPNIAKAAQVLVEKYNAPPVELSPSTQEVVASLRTELEGQRAELEEQRSELEEQRQARFAAEQARLAAEQARLAAEEARLAAETKLAALEYALHES